MVKKSTSYFDTSNISFYMTLKIKEENGNHTFCLGVSKITGKLKNQKTRKSENQRPGSDLENPKTEYPNSGTRFLLPDFYRVTENQGFHII